MNANNLAIDELISWLDDTEQLFSDQKSPSSDPKVIQEQLQAQKV